ncbi:hypothetical protein Pmani_004300 [Petrolisthes manimaculis]|uniref:Integrase catalytic domain-containing protein n=1 Tax=Petrolisthes manimaculis TaxID=1843537 RepID=A0AAE1ULQ4_9EUCA|nr:hypothetical protein Pmani_004300 [Petrolisthes manimaculis]
MVHGKPRYPQSQGSFERANGDIKDMLVAWLTDNESQDWVAGIKFVQFQKNSSHHAGIKRSPYSALFGKEARVGLTTSSLPRKILHNLESEHDLARLDLALASPQLNPPLLLPLWMNPPLLPPLWMNPLLLPPLRLNPPLLLPLRLKLVPLQLTLPLIHLNQILLLRQKLTTI